MEYSFQKWFSALYCLCIVVWYKVVETFQFLFLYKQPYLRSSKAKKTNLERKKMPSHYITYIILEDNINKLVLMEQFSPVVQYFS